MLGIVGIRLLKYTLDILTDVGLKSLVSFFTIVL